MNQNDRPQPISRRRFLVLSAAGLAAAACSQAPPPAATQAPAPKAAVPTTQVNVVPPTAAAAAQPTALPAVAVKSAQTTMVIAEDVGPVTLDPHFYEGGALRNFINNTAMKLLVYDDKMVLRPDACESYQLMPDKLTWRFKMRPNLKFWNGEPLDAEAVKFTFDRIVDPELRKKGLNDPFQSRIGLKETKVVDKLTVDVITQEPNILVPIWVQAETILAPKYYSSKSIEETAIAPMGAGPWKFVEWVKGSHYALEANPDYYRGKPPIDKITVRHIPDRSTRVALLQRGEAQLATTLLPDDMPIIEGDANLRMAISPGSWRVHLQIPTYKYTDKRVRQAFNYLVPYDALDKGLLKGILGPSLRMYSPASGMAWHAPDVKPYPYDPEKAKQLLKDAKWNMDSEIVIYGPIGSRMRDKDVVQALAAEFKKIGLNSRAEVVDAAVYNPNLRKDFYKDIMFQGLGTRWNGPEDMTIVLPDSGFDNSHWTENTEGGKKFLDLIAKMKQEFDETKQKEFVWELERIHTDEAPWMYLWLEPRLYAASKKLAWNPPGIGMLELWPIGGDPVRFNV